MFHQWGKINGKIIFSIRWECKRHRIAANWLNKLCVCFLIKCKVSIVLGSVVESRWPGVAWSRNLEQDRERRGNDTKMFESFADDIGLSISPLTNRWTGRNHIIDTGNFMHFGRLLNWVYAKMDGKNCLPFRIPFARVCVCVSYVYQLPSRRHKNHYNIRWTE